jgi:hypothetical protein
MGKKARAEKTGIKKETAQGLFFCIPKKGKKAIKSGSNGLCIVFRAPQAGVEPTTY